MWPTWFRVRQCLDIIFYLLWFFRENKCHCQNTNNSYLITFLSLTYAKAISPLDLITFLISVWICRLDYCAWDDYFHSCVNFYSGNIRMVQNVLGFDHLFSKALLGYQASCLTQFFNKGFISTCCRHLIHFRPIKKNLVFFSNYKQRKLQLEFHRLTLKTVG